MLKNYANKSRAQIIQEVKAAKNIADLRVHLQGAIELEHSTIPPYLTGLYSIKLNTNQAVARIIFSIVRQEMLHITIAANILNAIGGKPVINHPEFIPQYPTHLPFHINPNLVVGLAPLSKQVVKDIFMGIEEPEYPQAFPVEYVAVEEYQLKSKFVKSDATEVTYETIGEFYLAIIEKLIELNKKGEKCIVGDPQLQVVNEQWYPLEMLFPITSVEEAIAAIQIIIEQGEGAGGGKNPLDQWGELGHYYNFSQIAEGYYLYEKAPGEFIYNQALPLPLDMTKIYDLVENSKANLYQPGSLARRLVDQFNASYTNLLNALHRTFNGEPNYLNTAIGVMFDLKLQAQTMAETTVYINGFEKRLAPSFEYFPVNAD